jgi:hypothetical protein
MSSRTRTSSRSASCSASGTHTAVNSPARYNRSGLLLLVVSLADYQEQVRLDARGSSQGILVGLQYEQYCADERLSPSALSVPSRILHTTLVCSRYKDVPFALSRQELP